MTQANTPITALDFDAIKQSLKAYLQGQDVFKDYDFEGSSLNIILDLLAYNTHYQAFYANMVVNESFLDSAVKKSSVVSIAKALGYTPRSPKSSRITLNLNFGSSNADLLDLTARGGAFIERGDAFISLVNGNALSFLALEPYRLKIIDGNVVAENVTVYEGRLKTMSYVVNGLTENPRYRIPSSNADIDTLRVSVQKSPSDSTGLIDSWTRSTDINNLSSDSRVFFVQETLEGEYEIYFGDGVLGKSLENGNLITVEYLVTNGVGGNGASSFSYIGSAGRGTTPTVTPTLNTNGTARTKS